MAVEIAKHFHAPIISTDSRQVYRNMAIGTAQPTAEELAAVKHYFIADREVEDDFNCGRYEVEALTLLDRLFTEHEYVVAVGGSGLYIQALCRGTLFATRIGSSGSPLTGRPPKNTRLSWAKSLVVSNSKW